MDLFKGRKLVIATKHGKELVIKPRVSSGLGADPFVPTHFDTDRLGTFTGEIERKHDPLTTLRLKCEMAMEFARCDLAIASEGSFGCHPTVPFITCDEEFVMLLDKKNNLEIVGRALSTSTNFDQKYCKSEKEVIGFAQLAKFPSHALIMRDQKVNHRVIYKGITGKQQLLKYFHEIKDQYGQVYVETDMRAMHNPTRMEVIAEVTDLLIERVITLCPVCNSPGFGVTDTRKGLACRQCHKPTQSMKMLIYSCMACNYREEIPNQKQPYEDPMYCDYCNP